MDCTGGANRVAIEERCPRAQLWAAAAAVTAGAVPGGRGADDGWLLEGGRGQRIAVAECEGAGWCARGQEVGGAAAGDWEREERGREAGTQLGRGEGALGRDAGCGSCLWVVAADCWRSVVWRCLCCSGRGSEDVETEVLVVSQWISAIPLAVRDVVCSEADRDCLAVRCGTGSNYIGPILVAHLVVDPVCSVVHDVLAQVVVSTEWSEERVDELIRWRFVLVLTEHVNQVSIGLAAQVWDLVALGDLVQFEPKEIGGKGVQGVARA